jgi:CRP/FNR family transcriptional regulator, anaerobic regulatory protein
MIDAEPMGSRPEPTVRELRSCFVAKLSHFIKLSNSERDLIMDLEQEERPCKRGAVVWRQGQQANSLYIVKSGWMHGYSMLADGRRQVLDIYLPGDVLGLRDIVFDYSVSAVAAINDVVLCPFPKTAVDDVFSASPRLATLLYSLGMLENIVVIDRLKSIGRLDAQERMCFFLLQLFHRLKITNPKMESHFELPMTQELIADALGLTPVHVNRTVRKLEIDELISRTGSQVTLRDPAELQRISGFEDRHYRIDTSWFPKR